MMDIMSVSVWWSWAQTLQPYLCQRAVEGISGGGGVHGRHLPGGILYAAVFPAQKGTLRADGDQNISDAFFDQLLCCELHLLNGVCGQLRDAGQLGFIGGDPV